MVQNSKVGFLLKNSLFYNTTNLIFFAAQIVVIYKSKERDLATSIPLGKKFPRVNDIKSAPEFQDLASKVTAAMGWLNRT